MNRDRRSRSQWGNGIRGGGEMDHLSALQTFNSYTLSSYFLFSNKSSIISFRQSLNENQNYINLPNTYTRSLDITNNLNSFYIIGDLFNNDSIIEILN